MHFRQHIRQYLISKIWFSNMDQNTNEDVLYSVCLLCVVSTGSVQKDLEMYCYKIISVAICLLLSHYWGYHYCHYSSILSYSTLFLHFCRFVIPSQSKSRRKNHVSRVSERVNIGLVFLVFELWLLRFSFIQNSEIYKCS